MINQSIAPRYTDEYWQCRTADVLELPILADIPQGVSYFDNPASVGHWLTQMNLSYPEKEFVYVTGGFDCAAHHEALIRQIHQERLNLILGLEDNAYIENKGSKPHFTFEQRKQFWLRKCSALTAIFPVPTLTRDYDELAKTTGSYKSPNVYHLSSVDDEFPIMQAREARCFDISRSLLAAVLLADAGVIVANLIPRANLLHSSQ